MRYIFTLLLLLWAPILYAQEIVQVEYYIDADPGIGNATPVGFTAGPDVDLDFNVDLSSATEGFHILYIRAKDSNNEWGLVYTKPFFNEPVTKPSAPISQVEYFFNDGNTSTTPQTVSSFTHSNDADINFIADVSNLGIGSTWNMHIIATDQHDRSSLQYIESVNITEDTIPFVTLSLDTTFTVPGDTACLDLTLTNTTSSSVNAIQFEIIASQPSFLQFVRIENEINDLDFSIDTQVVNDTTIFIVHPNLNPQVSDAVIDPGVINIGKLVYSTDSNAPLETAIMLHLNAVVISDDSGEEIPNFAVDGTINLINNRGDLNGDSRIDVLDVTKLIRIIVAKDPTPGAGSLLFPAADANGDGTINVVDVVHQINKILRRIPKPIAARALLPVTVGFVESKISPGENLIPISFKSDVVVAAIQMSISFDPFIQIGTPKLSDRTAHMTMESHASDGILHVVIYSLAGHTIEPGEEPIFLISVTVGESQQSVNLNIDQAVLANLHAQSMPLKIDLESINCFV